MPKQVPNGVNAADLVFANLGTLSTAGGRLQEGAVEVRSAFQRDDRKVAEALAS